MVNKLKFRFYVNPSEDSKYVCVCNANDPLCPKGYQGHCILIKHTYNPYEGIEECMKHDSYKRVNRRLRQR